VSIDGDWKQEKEDAGVSDDRNEHTGVGGLVGVVLALVEAVLLLLLLESRVADGALVVSLVDGRVSDR